QSVPRRRLYPSTRTIWIRVPDNAICQARLAEYGEPLMTSTLLLPGDEYPLSDPVDIANMLEHQVDVIIDGGFGGLEETTVISLADGGGPEILRKGAGPLDEIY